MENTTHTSISGSDKRRFERDHKVVVAMAQLYCKAHHDNQTAPLGLCPDCTKVVEYVRERTERCPHKHKGVCEKCTIHCYKPAMRANIRAIMAYAGPRMIFHHPVMTIRHIAKKISLKGKELE